MHELSLMEGIMDLARRTAAEHGLVRLRVIRLSLGEMTAAFPDALRAAFEALGQEPLFAAAELEIETVPLLASCRECGREFAPASWRFICPDCAGTSVDIVRGRELYIDYIEGDKDED